MADNRMWLIHRPSGRFVYLGKRLGPAWHNPLMEFVGDSLAVLFDTCNGDDYVIGMEDVRDAPGAIEIGYSAPGTPRIKVKE